jgi:hypothetical protein
MVRLPSFPNSASAEILVSSSLLILGMDLTFIQLEGKGGEVS